MRLLQRDNTNEIQNLEIHQTQLIGFVAASYCFYHQFIVV